MNNCLHRLRQIALCWFFATLPQACFAGPQAAASPAPPAPAEPLPQREIFVPIGDLRVILLSDIQRVFVTRAEYETLAAQARAAAKTSDPTRPAAVLSADYVANVEENRARIMGTLVVTAPDDQLSAIELDLSGVALRSATLDGQPASLGRNPAGAAVLFVRGAGRHTLKVEILAAVETAAAERTLSFQIPTPPATRLRLSVPGHVELKSGGTVIRRRTDEDAQTTEFDLLPRRGTNNLVLSLNNRQLQNERVVVAHGVLIDEITSAYERLHVTASLSVLHGATDRFRFALPEGFEVTGASAPEVARWEVATEEVAGADPRRVLTVFLREPTTDTIALNISAARSPVPLDEWQMPKLSALDVAGEAMVLGLLVESRLKPADIRPENLISIDVDVLAHALPASVEQDRAGAPPVRAMAAFYAPRAGYELRARFDAPQSELRATTNVLLTLSEEQLEAHGGFALVDAHDRLVEFDFSAPSGWQVTEVTAEGGAPLPIDAYPAADGGTRIHVRMPGSAAPGQSRSVYFRAVSSPEGWLGDWRTRPLEFPVFQVAGATRDVGAVAVLTRDDMLVRAADVDRLTPLDANEKSKYGLQDVPTQLAFRYEAPPYTLRLEATRVEPRLTARAFSFFRADGELLTAHYEIVYEANEARTSRLVFELPESTPGELAIRGLDGLAIKQSTSTVADSVRRWTVQLAESRRGSMRIAVDFQQPLPAPAEAPAATDVPLPLIQAGGVAYQSGMVAVEGSADRDVQVQTTLRKVDVGELAEADYQPGRRLLGAFAYGGGAGQVQVRVVRPPEYDLPSAIVERAELVSIVSAAGRSQTVARFRLRAKAPAIEVRLPPGSTLWSALVDRQPSLPQREGDSLLVALPVAAEVQLRDLQLVYETPIAGWSGLGQVDLAAPELLLHGRSKAAIVPVPLADLVWRLGTPTGTKVVRSSGTVFSTAIAERQSPLAAIARTVSGYTASSFAAASRTKSKSEFGVKMAPPAATVDNARSMVRHEAGEYFEDGSVQDGEKFPGEAAPGVDSFALPGDADDVTKLADQSMPSTDDTALVQEGEKALEAPAAAPGGGGMGGMGGGIGRPAAAKRPARQPSVWALEGLRSLPIELQSDSIQIPFQSLGAQPRLAVTLVDQTRLDLLGWGVALAIFLRGVWISDRSLGQRLRLLGLTLGLAYVLPLLLPYSGLVSPVCNMAFYAGCWLVVYYLVAALARRLVRVCRRAAGHYGAVTAAAALVGLLCLAPHTAGADEPTVPVAVPADAIIIPYDPDEFDPLAALSADPAEARPDAANPDAVPRRAAKPAVDPGQKILLPYDKYLEMLRAVQPDGKVRGVPPAEYVLSDGQFQATLNGDQSLEVEGHVDIEVLVDHAVRVPLGLAGGVPTKATLSNLADQAAAPKTAIGGLGVAGQSGPQAGPAGDAPLAVIVPGAGRWRLALAMRFRIVRQGGWQVVDGRVPSAVATALRLNVAQAHTEVILRGGPDRGKFETKRDGESIETALGADGALHVEWRAKLGAAPVDQSLSVTGRQVFDVQEGGLRLVARLDLSLHGAPRARFTLDVPAGYLVEKVTGSNVRGWQLDAAPRDHELTVTLLQPAQVSESFSVTLAVRGAVGSGDLAEFDVPLLKVQSAVQQSGELAIRRSPLLQLRTDSAVGVSRADAGAGGPEAAGEAEESPLGILPYQFYRFATTAFAVRLSARPVVPRVSAAFESVLKISARQRSLESRIRVRVADRPIYRLQLALPADWKLDRVTAPEPFEWVVGTRGERPTVNLYFAGGQAKPFDVVLAGVWGEYGPVENLVAQAPEIVAVDEQTEGIEQSGDLVVEADPALGVRADKLVGCESELLSAVSGWLAPDQQSMARLALRYRRPQFSAQLLVAPRKPIVHAIVVSNVRVTQRTIEETILLDFTIREAGIRSLSFLLPADMSDARIGAPMLRQKTITPVEGDPAGRVRVRLELQEEVMNNLRVLVEDDRLLTGAKYLAPIPQVETGETDERYVTLESAGRDEVVVAEHFAVDPVSPEQTEWRMLSALLGRGLTQAYTASPSAADPRLVLRAQDRAAVETAGARIGLAKATLMIDAQGTFRGSQLYRLDNSTEQYLVVRLPAGAHLWTAHVAGEPVKPATDKTPDLVRIPLVKTAPGDADYPVVLTYGGQLGRLAALDQVAFPLMRTVNINVELSQVELYAPESYKWFDFGGTMRLVDSEGYLAAGLLEYNTRQIGLAVSALHSEDSYAKARAANNLKALQADAVRLKQSASGYLDNAELAQQLQKNEQAQQGLEVQINSPPAQNGVVDALDNRGRLGNFYRAQTGTRANDVVSQSELNFQPPAQTAAVSAQPAGGQGQALNPRWLAQNKLQNEQADMPAAKKLAGSWAAAPPQFGANAPALQAPAQPAAPKAFAKDALPQSEADQKRDLAEPESAARRSQRQLERYADRLEKQQQKVQPADEGFNYGLGMAGGPVPGAAPQPPTDSAPESRETAPDGRPGQMPASGPLLGEPVGQALAPASLASLNVDLTMRGQRFLFTTPRGDVEVTARAVAQPLLGRALRLIVLAIGLAVLWAIIRRLGRRPAASGMPIAHTH